jgi:hypothetical protein
MNWWEIPYHNITIHLEPHPRDTRYHSWNFPVYLDGQFLCLVDGSPSPGNDDWGDWVETSERVKYETPSME